MIRLVELTKAEETRLALEALDAMIEALVGAEEYFDNRADIVTGEYGMTEPNREAVLQRDAAKALIKAAFVKKVLTKSALTR